MNEEPMSGDERTRIFLLSSEIGEMVVGRFSERHPSVVATYAQWQDLQEMIQREVFGQFSDSGTCAGDWKECETQ